MYFLNRGDVRVKFPSVFHHDERLDQRSRVLCLNKAVSLELIFRDGFLGLSKRLFSQSIFSGSVSASKREKALIYRMRYSTCISSNYSLSVPLMANFIIVQFGFYFFSFFVGVEGVYISELAPVINWLPMPFFVGVEARRPFEGI